MGGSTAAGGALSAGGAFAGGATGSSAQGGSTGAGGSSHVGKWQIMPLGDSITETTCYPKLLAQELTSKGHTGFDFVGKSLNNQSCGDAPNVQTEGHSCYLVTNLVKDVATVAGCGGTKGSLAELKSWATEKPDVVLMEYGTNDAWSSIATQSILDAFGSVVDEFRLQNPKVIFFVAQITPLNPSGCANCEANVEALNAKIPAWASGKSTAASPVYVVNVWASLPAASYTPSSAYTSDGCHPNPAGSQLVADAWYAALVANGIP
jgi:lysophospholipase L1-like esterase